MLKRETHQHADRRRERHGQQEADEAEQIAEGEEREHQPDRMEADAVADEIGREEVALDELAEDENADDDQDLQPVGPELDERHADGEDAADDRADIRE